LGFGFWWARFFSFVVLRFRVLLAVGLENEFGELVFAILLWQQWGWVGGSKFCTCVVAMEEIFALFVVSLQRFFSQMEVVEVVKCLCLLITTTYAFFPFFVTCYGVVFFLVHEKRMMHVFIWFVSCLLLV
jgi:hypothetical protein